MSAANSGNIVFAPYRSVSAPAGTRPIEPTRTGTATSSDCWKELRPSRSPYQLASGAIRFHAQKVRVKPMVAITRLR